MSILSSNEIFFTAFQPKVANQFIMYVDGIPSYLIKGFGGVSFESPEIVLNHINVMRKIKGRTKWNDVNLTLFDPITPSGVQACMEWQRLHHESVTGRDGYSDFYKKDITFNVLGPVGDIVCEWILKGAWIKDGKFGEYSWDEEAKAVNIDLTLAIDYAILNF